MRYSTFRKEIGIMGFRLTKNFQFITVIDEKDIPVITIDLNEMYLINTYYNSFHELEFEVKTKLFQLACEFSGTPKERR